MSKSFKIFTFGCKTNRQESDFISQELKRVGFVELSKDDSTDLIVINSCTVTSNADDEILYLVRKLKRNEPEAKIILTGCLAQVDSKNLAKDENIDLILGNSEKLKIVEYLERNNIFVEDLMQKTEFDEFKLSTTSRTRATLKIQDGCNNFCSYCIIPFARGKSRSSKLENVVANIQEYVNNGYKEIVLSGIHLGLWGEEFIPQSKFVDLLKEIEKIDGLVRYRIGSLNPQELDDELMAFLISSKKVCNHLHVSLQSATNKTLENMNRHYTIEETKAKLCFLRENIPNINIGADVIVGFPGETDEDYLTTYNNIAEMPFSYMHIFPYSIRKYTRASEMPNQVQDEVKKYRAQNLKELISKKQNEFLNSLIGTCQNVLIEHAKTDTNLYKGIASNYVKFIVEADKNISNNIVNVRGIEVRDKKIFAKFNN